MNGNVPRVCVGRIINAKFYEMKHAEKYLQAKWVTENPDGYDERDVVDAKRYCNAYLDGYNQALRIHDVICCGVLEKMNLGWMKLEDGTRCMPYIKGHSDENMYRVNNCPSCGKYVRDVMVEP